MSGDNLHGKQPIKFYSEKITLTKVELLEAVEFRRKNFRFRSKA